MSLLRTKPRWCQFTEATEQGWINSKTGELLVSIRGLKSKLEAETTVVEPIKEVIMETVKEEVKPVQKQIKEQTIKKPKKNQKLIAEVVEYNLDDKEVLGE